MKNKKKFFSVLVAWALIFSMFLPVFAEGDLSLEGGSGVAEVLKKESFRELEGPKDEGPSLEDPKGKEARDAFGTAKEDPTFEKLKAAQKAIRKMDEGEGRRALEGEFEAFVAPIADRLIADLKENYSEEAKYNAQAISSLTRDKKIRFDKISAIVDGIWISQGITQITEDIQGGRFHGSDNIWPSIGLAMAGKGDSIQEEPLINTIRSLLETKKKGTNYEKAIIALTAAGYDATKYTDSSGNHVDLIEQVAYWKGNIGSLNDWIFALLAYNSGNYTVSERAPYAPSKIIRKVLDCQSSNGGWSLASTDSSVGDFGADTDITAMTLYSLAPYQGDPEVARAIGRALDFLETQMTERGMNGAMGGVSSESTSQTILALTALGRDPDSISKNGVTLMEALKGYMTYGKVEGQRRIRFAHTGIEPNVMATEQAYQALVEYDHFKEEGRGRYLYQFPTPTKSLITETVRRVTGITITGYPKTEYTVGDTVDMSGLKIQVNYSDGTSEEIRYPNANMTVDTMDTSTSGPRWITVTYLGKTAQFRGVVKEEETSETTPGGDKKLAYISVVDPKGKTFFPKGAFSIVPGVDTAFSILQKTGLQYRLGGSDQYAGVYVAEIEGLAEFDKGQYSGWMYRVNGIFPPFSSSLYKLKEGDYVEWLYTRDLGKDVGGYIEGIEKNPGTSGGTGTTSTKHYVTVRIEGKGTVAPNGKVEITGEKPVTFTFTPNPGWEVERVLLGGTDQGKVTSLSVKSLDKDKDLVVVFKEIGKESTTVDKKTLPRGEFVDTLGHWGEKAIAYVVQKGYFKGMDESYFGPERPMTRGMFVTVLGRMAKVEGKKGSSPFTDLKEDMYYSPYVAWASENAIVKGYEDHSFQPDKNITREEMAVLMVRFLEFRGMNLPLGKAPVFTDSSAISPWSQRDVETMGAMGLLKGREGGIFAPKANVKRAEVAMILQRLDEVVKGKESNK